jgi:putative transposase
VSPEVRALIFRMAGENPTWGAPRIDGELLKLGFDLSEPTVSRWLRTRSKNLYCFFVIGHDRRKILGWNLTRNPNALWILQQMREAWPYSPAHSFLIFDRDSKFGEEVVSFAKGMGSEPVRTGFRRPWQNGVAEGWVATCRRGLLDHVIVLNERHLKRLVAEYVRYYHEDRTHLGLAKDTPTGRPIALRPRAGSTIRSLPRLGGLHHRYAA